MAHFQSTGPTRGQPTWRPATEYTPVEQLNHKQNVSISYIEDARQLSRKESYRPLPHRTASLLFIAIVISGLVGALEYSLRVLPLNTVNAPASVSTGNASIAKRQDPAASAAAAPTADAAMTAPAEVSITPVQPSSSFFQAVATTFKGEIAPTTASTAYINAEGTTVTSAPIGAGTPGAAAPGAGTPGAGAWTPIGGGTVGAEVVPTSAASPVGGGSAATPSAVPTGDRVAGGIPEGGSQKEPILNSDVPLTLVKHPYNYFLSLYAPVLISVLIRLLLGYLFRSTKLVDPFFMLSNPDGSPFPLWEDHLGCETVFAPWYAIRSRRWLLLWTAVAYAASQLLSPFASELTNIQLGMYKLDNGFVRGHSIWINPVIVRLLETLLGIIFVLVIFTGVMLRRTKSNVRTNPASIATIAALVGHPATARDLSINQWADKAATSQLFEGRRYRLGSYMAEGTECYGIVPVGDLPPLHDTEDAHAPVSRSVAHKDTVNLFLVTASATVLFGIILDYLKTSTSTSLERFMDSQSFGPRFLLSALGLLLKSPLLALCARTAASVPFSRLAKRPRRENDIDTPVPITPQGAIGYTLKRRAWFASGVALTSGVIIEVLLILLPGVPFNTRLSWSAARVSWYGSLTCLGLILVVALIGWARLFSMSNEWPKSPTTVGAIAMYVAGTAMSADHATDGETVSSRRIYYEFGMRSGRWIVEYSAKGSRESATPMHSVHGEQPSLPNFPTPFQTQYSHSPVSPAPSYTPFNPVQDTGRRYSAFDARRDSAVSAGRQPVHAHHSRAASYSGYSTSYASMPSAAHSNHNSLTHVESYPGRPQYGT